MVGVMDWWQAYSFSVTRKMGTFPKSGEDHNKASFDAQERAAGMTIWRGSLRPLICSISCIAAWRPESA